MRRVIYLVLCLLSWQITALAQPITRFDIDAIRKGVSPLKAMELRPLPEGVMLFQEAITPRIRSGSSSQCTVNMYVGTTADLVGVRSETQLSYSVTKDESGLVKFVMPMVLELPGMDPIPERVVFTVGKNGQLLMSDPEFQFDLPQSVREGRTTRDKQVYAEVKQAAKRQLQTLREPGMLAYLPVGQSFRVGSPVPMPSMNLCGLVQKAPKTTQPSTEGPIHVLGTAKVNGRDMLVAGGEFGQSCVLGAASVNFTGKSWWSYDLSNGTQGDGSIAAVISLPGQPDVLLAVDASCTAFDPDESPIVHQATGAARPAGSVEKRLSELKSLLDKGLVTKDEFDQKRAEILKSL